MNAKQNKQHLLKRMTFTNYAILPAGILLLIILGWSVIHHPQVLTQTTIAAYQQTELEIVRAAARSAVDYVNDQVHEHYNKDISAIEQEMFRRVISPIRLLENGDAWIYAPDHVVYTQSADFPEVYMGKSMAEIFAIQQAKGASHFEEMADAVMNAREGVGWYVWLPEKGREISAWTPVRVGEHIWTIGLSIPLSEILEATGAADQIRTSYWFVGLTAVIVFGLLAAWQVSLVRRNQAEKALQKRTYDLNERVKELNCLYGISALIGKPGVALENIMQASVALIAVAWQYPEITCVRIIMDGREFKTADFKETVLKQESDINVNGVHIGAVEVCYLEARLISDEGPFLKEERNLINAIAEQIGKIIAHKRAEEALRKAHNALEMQVEQRTAELVKANEILRENESKYKKLSKQFRLMSDNIPDLVWAKDLDGNFTFVNKAICDKLLIAKDTREPIGRKDMFFVMRQRSLHPERDDWHTFGEVCTNSDDVVIKSQKAQRFDEYGNINGEFLFLDVYKAPIFDDNGEMIGTVGHGRIVTREKENEKLLQESETRFKALSDATYEGIFFIDNGVIIDANRAACKMTGYAYNELLGMRATGLAAAESVQTVKQNMLAGYEKPYDAIAQHKNGVKFHIQIQGKMFEYQSRQIRVSTVIDITSRKKSEEKLRLYAQTQEAMAREMNHRVKNNLAAISGMLFIEQRHAVKSAQGRVQVAILDKVANRIKGLSMVYQLLSDSDWVPIPLNELALQMVHAALQALPSKKRPSVRVFCAAPAAVTPEEAHHLAIVFNELASNVVKHAVSVREKIEISVRITPAADTKTIQIEFRDNGPGFTEVALNAQGRHVGLYLAENTVRHSLCGDIRFYNDAGAVVTISQIKLQHWPEHAA